MKEQNPSHAVIFWVCVCVYSLLPDCSPSPLVFLQCPCVRGCSCADFFFAKSTVFSAALESQCGLLLTGAVGGGALLVRILWDLYSGDAVDSLNFYTAYHLEWWRLPKLNHSLDTHRQKIFLFSFSFLLLADVCLPPAAAWCQKTGIYTVLMPHVSPFTVGLHKALMKNVTRVIWQTGTKVRWWPWGFLGRRLSHALSGEESRRVTW